MPAVDRDALVCDVDYAIVDAGYYSEKNVRELQEAMIAFSTSLKPNLKLYKALVADHYKDIGKSKYLVKYQTRFLHIKPVEIPLFGRTGFAYIIYARMTTSSISRKKAII